MKKKKKIEVNIVTKFDEIFTNSGFKISKVLEDYEELTGKQMSYDQFYDIRKNRRPVSSMELLFLSKIFGIKCESDAIDMEKSIFTEN